MKSRNVSFLSLAVLFMSCASVNVPLKSNVQVSETYHGTYDVFMIDTAPVQTAREPLGTVILDLQRTETATHQYDLTGTLEMDQATTYQVEGTMNCVQYEGAVCTLEFKATHDGYVYQVKASVVSQQLMEGQMTGYSVVPPGDILKSFKLKAMRQ